MSASGGRDYGSDYVIGDLLGTSPAGEVYAGRDPSGGPVAVTFLHLDLAGDPDVAARCVVERDTVLGLRGENLVAVRDLVIEDGCTLAVVTDLPPAVDLRRALAAVSGRRKRFPAAEACRLAAGVARGLAVVHAAGLAYGAVDAANVLLDGSVSPPAPLLADVVTARLTAPAGSSVAADLLALGGLLHELATGTPPAAGQVAAGLSEPLRALLAGMLAADPAERPASALRVADALDTIAAGLRGAGGAAGSGAPGPAGVRPAATTATLPAAPPAVAAAAPAASADRRTAALVGAVCAALVLGATVAWNLTHDPGPVAPTAGQAQLAQDGPAALPASPGVPAAAASAAPVPTPAVSGAPQPSVSAAPAGPDAGTGDGQPAAVPEAGAEAGGQGTAAARRGAAVGGAGAAAAGTSFSGASASGAAAGTTAPAAAPAPGRGIAYLSDRDGDWQLYRAEAGDDRRLTDVRGGVMGPAWSPDARRIAYFAAEGGRNVLWVMDADGGNHVRLHDNAMRPVFSPDSRTIAFEGEWNGNLELFVIGVDGSGLRRLTSDGSGTAARWPAFSPDSRTVAYAGYTGVDGVPTGSVWVVGTDGEDRRRVVADGVQPAFSPDGRRIVFTRPQGKGHDIYSIGADGRGESRLTSADGTDWSPAFSPDGKRILFLSNRGDTASEGYDVYVMDADGTDPHRLTAGSGTRSAATFSPDGRKIAYNQLRTSKPQQFEIYVMNVDGTGKTRLAEDGYGPVWGSAGR